MPPTPPMTPPPRSPTSCGSFSANFDSSSIILDLSGMNFELELLAHLL